MNIAELQDKTNEELMGIAREMGVIDNGAVPRRHALMMKVLQGLAERNGQVLASGVLSIAGEGYGFLKSNGRHAGSSDVYVSQSQIRRFGLRDRRPRHRPGQAAQGRRAILRPHTRRGR